VPQRYEKYPEITPCPGTCPQPPSEGRRSRPFTVGSDPPTVVEGPPTACRYTIWRNSCDCSSSEREAVRDASPSRHTRHRPSRPQTNVAIMAEQQRNHTTTSAPRDDDVLTLDVATPSDSVVTVIAHGEIDLDTAPRLHDCLRQHLRPGGSLVLDTTAVTYCGSSGAAELVGAATAAREVGAEITVVIPPTSRHPVRRVLTLLGVLHMLSVRPGPFIPQPRTA
jgi:anti-anti-sigma factor